MFNDDEKKVLIDLIKEKLNKGLDGDSKMDVLRDCKRKLEMPVPFSDLAFWFRAGYMDGVERLVNYNINVDDVLRVLNGAVMADADAMRALIFNRVECNRQLADHPTIQVDGYTKPGKYFVGLLGVINGLFGIGKDGMGSIAAEFEVVCKNKCVVPNGMTIDDKCLQCGEQLELGRLLKFFKVSEVK